MGNDVSSVKEMMAKVHKMFLEAGMPDDRIDYILEKGVKYVYPEALAPADVDTKDCHAKVDWKKIGELKEGFFARLKFVKEKSDVSMVKEMMAKVRKMFLEAGMPGDRIDYT